MKQIDYINALKGIAILGVVFAHIIAWSYNDFHAFYTNFSQSWLFKFIYSFHMPLFFFISGFLAYRSYSKSSAFTILKRRTFQLLIPYICSTLFVEIILNQEMNYWFLIALYVMYLVTSFSQKFKVCPLILYFIIYGTSIIFPILNNIPYLFLPSFKTHYISFLLGFYICKYPQTLIWLRHHIYPYALIVFLILFIAPNFIKELENVLNLINGRVLLLYNFIKSTFAIIFLFFYFEENKENIPKYNWLTKIGQQTLIIYIIHVLFKYTIPLIGDYIDPYIQYPVIVQIIYATIISIILIQISIIIGQIFNS